MAEADLSSHCGLVFGEAEKGISDQGLATEQNSDRPDIIMALTTIDAENAADAAYAGVRTVTFKVKSVKESK